MRQPPLILIVDDDADNRDIVSRRLKLHSYEVMAVGDGPSGLRMIRELRPDLVILDIMMPGLDGMEVLRLVRSDDSLPFIPIVMLTSKGSITDVVAGLEGGADDYLVKPVEQAELLSRVRAMLRLTEVHSRLEQQAAELAEFNARLEARVAAQVDEIGRIQHLRRFLAPQVVRTFSELGLPGLEGQRREIVSLFCDLRSFTAFAEVSEPEEVMAVLKQFHNALGPLVHRLEGTIERFTGDGMAVFFNAPLDCSEPAVRAVKLAVEMQAAVQALMTGWSRRGHRVGFGVGIAQGFATCGLIGFEERVDYAAIGTVTNTAARLCAHAENGQILITELVASEVEDTAQIEPLGDIAFKGLAKPIRVFSVLSSSN